MSKTHDTYVDPKDAKVNVTHCGEQRLISYSTRDPFLSPTARDAHRPEHQGLGDPPSSKDYSTVASSPFRPSRPHLPRPRPCAGGVALQVDPEGTFSPYAEDRERHVPESGTAHARTPWSLT